MASLHNRTRPKNYRAWLTNSDEDISSSTLRSRASSEQRRQQQDGLQDDACYDSPTNAATADNVMESDSPPSVVNDPEPQLLPDGDEFIYPGAQVKKNELLLLVMAFVLRFKLPAAACQALLTLFDIILPGCIPTTNYLVDKLFDFDSRTVQIHYFCSSCMTYFGVSVPQICSQCNVDPKLCESSFMFVLPLVDQLEQILQKNRNFRYIFDAKKNLSNLLTDVFDGKMYKKLRGHANITLQFNCDGAPIFNSSRFSLWPLMCGLNELPTNVRNCNMILHTLWFGRIKPCVSTFLQPFVSEIVHLYNNGFNFVNSVTGEVHRLYVNATLCICDAPARAMLQEFSQFNGQYGCGFCYHPGERRQKGAGTVQIYPLNTVHPYRSHHETVKYAEQATASGRPVKGVKGASILLLLPNFDIIRSFVPDYMHCALLGVVRQFVNLWTDSSSHTQPFYIRNIQTIDTMFRAIKIPDEIHRLPRSLADRKFWKASEYRSFLLIYSPIVLLHVLPKRYYRHWLLLVHALHLLLQCEITDVMVNTSKKCLNKFVALVPELYGDAHVSYNIHILTHLPDSVLHWGPLWSQSAFIYEDLIGILKSMYHGTQLIPRQIFKYFSAWSKLQNYTVLMVSSDDSVIELYKKFSTSTRSIITAFAFENFVGLRKSLKTAVSEFQYTVLRNFLQCDNACHLHCQSFDRFIINQKVFSTEIYACDYRRSNCFVLLTNGCFATIKSCFVVHTCGCDGDCTCLKHVVLFVACCMSTSASSNRDTYVGTNLTQFIRVLEQNEENIIAVSPGDIVGKSVIVYDVTEKAYALQVLQFAV